MCSALFFGIVGLAGCNEEVAQAPPPPHELTPAAIGHYCGMNVLEHAGPKGQIILASRTDPIWFSSARDAIAFTMLPEEPKDIRAIYVSDIAKAPSWEDPGANNWVDARQALFVIGKQGAKGEWVHLKQSHFRVEPPLISSLARMADKLSPLTTFHATMFSVPNQVR